MQWYVARHTLNTSLLPVTKLQRFPLQAEAAEGMFRLHELLEILEN